MLGIVVTGTQVSYHDAGYDGYINCFSHQPTDQIGQFRIVQQQKNRVEVQGNNLHFPLFWTIQNANYSPEPRLCYFVAAQFETSLLWGPGWGKGAYVNYQLKFCILKHLSTDSYILGC